MNIYTIEELLTLREAIRYADLGVSHVDTPKSAVTNVSTIINNYKNLGPEKILEKVIEFADIGRMQFSVLDAVVSPYVIVYNLIYKDNLDDMPTYLETPYEAIAVWRLQLSKKITE
jgi:hypothetical protein